MSHNNTQSAAMQAFCTAHPQLATIAIARDASAQSFFGEARYKIYGQGATTAIILRRAHAPAPGKPAEFTDDGICKVCHTSSSDKHRHNRQVHVKDPARTVFCPHDTCDYSSFRFDSMDLGIHLATKHRDFRNPKGYGRLLRDDSIEPANFNRIGKSLTIYIAKHRQAEVQHSLEYRDIFLKTLALINIHCAELVGATLPDALQPGAVNIDNLSKDEAVQHAILVRVTLDAWQDIFYTAECMLDEAHGF